MYHAIEVAKWLLAANFVNQKTNSEVDKITNLKLQKLLYYAQGIYLAVYDEPLFDDPIVAWQHGPVVEDVYYIYKKHRGNPIPFNPDNADIEIVNLINSDKKAQEILRLTYDEFGKFTAWALRDRTHQERPWKETSISEVIDNSLIQEFFKSDIVEV